MKKFIYSVSALLALSMASCVSNDDNYNNNETKAYEVPAETLLTNAEKELADQVSTPSVNLNPLRYYTQYWSAVQYNTEARYNVINRSISASIWVNFYRDVLGNLESAKLLVDQETLTDAAVKKNKKAILQVLQIYTYQLLVDTFGDVPYTEALDPLNVLPKYDDDASIYPDLLTKLNAAIADFDDSATSFDSGDILLGGDITAWKKFANSLKVKIAINLADVNPTLAKTTIEQAVAQDLITTNLDNVAFAYSGNPPFYNQIYANLVQSGRNDFVPCKTIVNEMSTLSDPRMTVYFTPKADGTYVGGNIGGTNTPYNSFSHIGDKLKEAAFPAVLMEASEINFYLAEAAARGYSVNGSVEDYYNAGIQQSFDYWGATGATSYIATTDVNYATASGDWKAKIGKQEWIALFNRPFESWNAWRRLDGPVLVPASNAVQAANGKIPVRLTYSITEQTVNNAAWQAASSAIGGDYLYTPVFWDTTQQ